MSKRPSNKKPQKSNSKRKKKFSARKWFMGLFFTAAVAIICGIIGYLLVVLNGERILAENANKLEFGEASIVYDINNNEIAKLYKADQNREIAEFTEMPEDLLNAIVAVEDERFYEHSGIDS